MESWIIAVLSAFTTAVILLIIYCLYNVHKLNQRDEKMRELVEKMRRKILKNKMMLIATGKFSENTAQDLAKATKPQDYFT